MDDVCHCGRCNGDGPDEPGRYEVKVVHALGIAQCCFNCAAYEYSQCAKHYRIYDGYDQVFREYPRPALWMVCPDWQLTDNKRRLSGMEREVKRWAKVDNG